VDTWVGDDGVVDALGEDKPVQPARYATARESSITERIPTNAEWRLGFVMSAEWEWSRPDIREVPAVPVELKALGYRYIPLG